ncbi:MAG: biopolymer transporter ExbD [Symploca sp. SIO2G7]|nr:biopolymer transporter ExbD [Symploca sp. SIO2G7]
MRGFNDETEDNVEVNILPMIDVIFAILSYFIISTLFLTRFDGLPVSLPQAQTSERQPDANFTVTVDADGQLSLNRQSIQVDSLKDTILGQVNAEQIAVVTIHADEDASHGQVVEVMDEVRTIEGAKLAIATRPKD